MNYSDDNLFVLASSQMTGMYIAAGSVVALIVVVIIFVAMRKPAGDGMPGEIDRRPDGPAAEPVRFEPPPDRRAAGTPGFVLPMPTEVPPVPTAPQQQVEFTAPAPTAPPPPTSPPPAPDRTVEIQREAPTQVITPEMLSAAAAAMRTRSRLVFRGGARDGETVALDSFPDGSCAIGRSDIPENQIVVRDDLKVSRFQHAILTRDDSGRFIIRDNNSANKVFVNDQCLDTTPVLLNSGDRIRLGLTEFEFVTEPVG